MQDGKIEMKRNYKTAIMVDGLKVSDAAVSVDIGEAESHWQW